jgi:sulfur-oxidizing protein SoxZ
MSIKIRAKAKNGMIDAKILATHSMESGLRKDSKTGKVIPAEYIEEMIIKNNGKVVVVAQMSGAVSKDPYVAVAFEGNAGDKIEVSWTDNMGKSASESANVR